MSKLLTHVFLELPVDALQVNLLCLQLLHSGPESVIFSLELLADFVQLLALILPEVVLYVCAFECFHFDAHRLQLRISFIFGLSFLSQDFFVIFELCLRFAFLVVHAGFKLVVDDLKSFDMLVA